MKFRLTIGPATFKRAIDKILRALSWTDIVVYLNDSVVFVNTLKEHKCSLEALWINWKSPFKCKATEMQNFAIEIIAT